MWLSVFQPWNSVWRPASARAVSTICGTLGPTTSTTGHRSAAEIKPDGGTKRAMMGDVLHEMYGKLGGFQGMFTGCSRYLMDFRGILSDLNFDLYGNLVGFNVMFRGFTGTQPKNMLYLPSLNSTLCNGKLSFYRKIICSWAIFRSYVKLPTVRCLSNKYGMKTQKFALLAGMETIEMVRP